MRFGTIASAHVVAASTLFTDNFDRANASTLGSGWVQDATAWSIASNVAQRTANGSDFATFNTDLGSPDHWSEMVAMDAASAYCLIAVRTSPAQRGQNQYGAFFVPSGNPQTPKIGKMVGGGYSDVATGTAVTVPTNPKLRLECQGTALRFYLNDVLILSSTDSSLTTGNYAGMNNAAGTSRNDNFRCGTFPFTP